MPEYILGFDIGTTGVKAGLFTPAGQLLGTTYREYKVQYPGPQRVEQSVDEMWTAQCQVSKELIRLLEINPEDIAAVGISSQRATFVPVDKNETPLTQFIGWQDKRSIEQCIEIDHKVGSELYYTIAGIPIEPTAAVSKILWLKENEIEIFDKTHTFASTQNVHLSQLGVQNAPCDLPSAAYLGLLDVNQLTWSAELLELLDIPVEKMPELAPSGQLVGEISPRAADATGLAAGIPVVTAGGDLQCAGLGLGVVSSGMVSVGIGTGGGVLIYLDQPLRHPEQGLNCLPYAVPNTWEMEGICLASGAAYKWYRDVLGEIEKITAHEKAVDTYEILNAQAAQAGPGSNGLLVMPSLIGAGAPNWYPRARGAIFGLTLATSKQDLTRAMLEGICLEIRWMLEAAQKSGTKIEEIRIWGGAAKSPVWNQIAADVYGLPAIKTFIPDAGLAGAAICAGLGVGIFSSPHEAAQNMAQIECVYEPNRALKSKYDEMFDIYKTIYQSLVQAGIYERIAAL